MDNEKFQKIINYLIKEEKKKRTIAIETESDLQIQYHQGRIEILNDISKIHQNE
ncbi:hypothetical protein ES705_09363 [subsurface metagenome]